MKKTLVLIFLLTVLFLEIFSQNSKPLYSGGMLFFQPGYTIMHNPYQKVESVGFGLGGILRFYPTKHICVGVSGGSQKTKYNTIGSENSFITLGYGGFIFGYTIAKDKFRFCASIGMARGKLRNFHISEQTGVEIKDAAFYSYGAWVTYPMLSFDYMLTKKISFTSQLINLTAVYNENDLYFCPVFQLGILFNR
ncbi:MAG: hypothetical protein PHW82_05960 [Bacteroidales bacterium]|nr:hypothetical protein [Bacteroidales bacterium]